MKVSPYDHIHETKRLLKPNIEHRCARAEHVFAGAGNLAHGRPIGADDDKAASSEIDAKYWAADLACAREKRCGIALVR